MHNRSDHAKGLWLAIVGILVLTPDALLIRLISADEWTLLFWRGLFTFGALTLFITAHRRTNPVQAFTRLSRKGVLVAFLFAVNTCLFVVSIRHTSVANTLVILSTAPIFAAAMSSLFLREHAPMRTWFTAVIGVVCIAAIMGEGLQRSTFIGDGAAVGVALFLAAILTLLRRGDLDTTPIVALGGLMTASMMVAFAAPFSLVGLDWVYMVILGGVVIPVSFGLTTEAPKYVPSAEVSLIFLLETVLGPFWVWLVIGEEPPELTLIGGAILITVLAVHTVLGLRAKRA
ncbi:DMT family transporter [Magnetovibrio sp. PR-2]|uniref:DMT family transporter n=1 Tax=Magnetovibrio sp. PR-2 TaxID=3120356 RepID=UPI002FCE11C3